MLEAHLQVTAANLATAIKRRANMIAKFEDAVAVEESTGVSPTHKSGMLLGGQEVNSIEGEWNLIPMFFTQHSHAKGSP